MARIMPPFFYAGRHVLWDFRLKEQPLLTDRMRKPQRPGVQCLTWEDLKGILHKLPVFAEAGAF